MCAWRFLDVLFVHLIYILLHVFTSHGFIQVMTVQIKCFQEIITIGYRVYRSYELPWFRTLSW